MSKKVNDQAKTMKSSPRSESDNIACSRTRRPSEDNHDHNSADSPLRWCEQKVVSCLMIKKLHEQREQDNVIDLRLVMSLGGGSCFLMNQQRQEQQQQRMMHKHKYK